MQTAMANRRLEEIDLREDEVEEGEGVDEHHGEDDDDDETPP